MANEFREPAPGQLALLQRFVNSVRCDDRADRLRDTASSGRWLQQNGLAPDDSPVDESGRERLVALRDTVRSMLKGNLRGAEDGDAFGRMNALAAATPFVVEMRDGRAVLRPLGTGMNAVAGQLISAIHSGMQDGTWQRLKICASEDCPMAFYDTSKNRSATWCSMAACGNRAKVRAYQSRKRSIASLVPRGD